MAERGDVISCPGGRPLHASAAHPPRPDPLQPQAPPGHRGAGPRADPLGGAAGGRPAGGAGGGGDRRPPLVDAGAHPAHRRATGRREGLEVRVRDGIREVSAGDLEMRGNDEAARTYLSTALARSAESTELRTPGGENGVEALRRFDAVVEEVAGTGGGDGGDGQPQRRDPHAGGRPGGERRRVVRGRAPAAEHRCRRPLRPPRPGLAGAAPGRPPPRTRGRCPRGRRARR